MACFGAQNLFWGYKLRDVNRLREENQNSHIWARIEKSTLESLVSFHDWGRITTLERSRKLLLN
jgi:hypothetical protein